MPDTGLPKPPVALLARLSVADFDQWKKGFQDHEALRASFGFVGDHINRSEDDPNKVALYLAASDLERGKEFTQSPELMEAMKETGVQGPPELMWVVPKVVDVVWDRELPSMIISHEVADFDAWLGGYAGADDLRASHGIVGHAADQPLDDPNSVLVYHQAESFDALRKFLGSDDLKAAMKAAGATSEPVVDFYTCYPGRRY